MRGAGTGALDRFAPELVDLGTLIVSSEARYGDTVAIYLFTSLWLFAFRFDFMCEQVLLDSDIAGSPFDTKHAAVNFLDGSCISPEAQSSVTR